MPVAWNLEMYRMTFHGHRGLADDLREARVGVHGHPYLLRRALDELGEDALGYEVRHLGAYGVHAEDEIGLGVGDYLEEAVGLALYKGLADGPEGELGLVDLVALFLGLGFGETERGHLGAAEGDALDQVTVLGQGVLARHVLYGDDALVSGLVGEPEAPDHVSGRVHAVLGGTSVLVYLDDATVAHLDFGHVQVQVLDHGLASDGDEERLRLQGLAFSFAGLAGGRVFAAVAATFALGLFLFARVGAGDLDLHAVVGLLQALGVGLRAGEYPDAAALELLLEGGGDLRVLQRHEAVQDLHDGYLGAEVVVHAGELDADGPGTEDYYRLGVALVVGDDVVRGDHLLPVELQARQGVYGGAGGDQDVSGLELLLAVVCFDLDLLGLDEAAHTVVDGDLVLLHQALHSAPELGYYLLATLGGLRVVELEIPDLDPVFLAVPGVVQEVGRLEQRLGRDASHVQACAPEVSALPLLDQGHAHSQLAGPNSRYVPGVPSADDYQVVLFSHPWLLSN